MSAPRQTSQKTAVSRAFATARRPLSAAEVWEAGRKLAPRLGLRTVFRQLATLVTEGTLVIVHYPGQPPRYEPVSREHRPHLICHGCQKLFLLEMEAPHLSVHAPPGFEITGEEVVFYGKCPDCAEAKTEHRTPNMERRTSNSRLGPG